MTCVNHNQSSTEIWFDIWMNIDYLPQIINYHAYKIVCLLLMLNYSISSTVAYSQFLSPHQFAEYFRRNCVSFAKFIFLFGEWKESQALFFGFAYKYFPSDILYRSYSRKNGLTFNFQLMTWHSVWTRTVSMSPCVYVV